jgi:hypothetical protein
MDPVSGALAMALAALVVAAGYGGLQQWLHHQRRTMLHRERMAAIEKGLEFPAVDVELRRARWVTNRLLLFVGLVWVSLGAGLYLTLRSLIGQPPFRIVWGEDRWGNLIWIDVGVRDGMQWIGLAIGGVGVAHLVVYLLNARKPQ